MRTRLYNTLRRTFSGGPDFSEFLSKAARTSSSESASPARLPEWLKTPIPVGDKFSSLKESLRGLKLHTVCEEARCPNIGDCWNGGKHGKATATIMLMGDECTRGCRFCAVKTSRMPKPLDPNEPENTAEAISKWGLDYVVLTSVDRDDLRDGGAGHFAETIQRIKNKNPDILVEVLTGDFQGMTEHVAKVVDAAPNVFAHNLETVERLTPSVRDRRAKYRQSLNVLEFAKLRDPGIYTKSSLMVGCGELENEVVQAMKDLRLVGVDFLTIGQYMRPTKRHMKVEAYIHPDQFEEYRLIGEQLGFKYVASGPLVRSSYRAGELYITNLLKGGNEN